MEKTFREYGPKQDFLFPRSFSEYVGENDLCIFIRDLVIEQADLSGVYEGYAESQGRPPFNPAMMTALLLYAYSQ
jgi:transposase